MKRSKFNLGHTKLLSCDLGSLVPIGCTEVLPGDSFQHNTSALVRFSPMLAPVMHPVHCSISHWYVPNRLIFDDWEDFITGGPDGNDDTVFPTIDMPVSGGAAVGSLADYLGVPTGVNSLEVSALPFRAYNLIFNENYRDQDLVSPVAISTAAGPDTTTNTTLLQGAWEKDYFTTARPWEQKGPAITIPIGDRAPVVPASPAVPPRFVGVSGTDPKGLNRTTADTAVRWHPTGTSPTSAGEAYWAAQTGLSADLSSASPITINLLREAFALQRYEEARARFGSRYTEYLRYLGVQSSDARLQRPEYLGGGKYPVQFSEVLQTAEGDDPVGTLRGHGIGVARSNRYRRYFEEHGYVITLMCVRPKTMYVQGLPRHWNRRTKEDYWQKELQHIGQQEVLNKEVYAAGAQPDGVFGYQDRYDEYRRHESWVSGQFRTTDSFWHFAREFASAPALNASFINCVPPEDPFAVPANNHLQVMVRHNLAARRLVAAKGDSFIF
nr:MAG: major capsid protein [Microvirus sp.]